MRTGILLKTSEDVLRRLRQTERNGMAHGRSEEDCMKKEVKAMQLKTEAERARTWRILTRGNAMQQHGIKGKQVNILHVKQTRGPLSTR